MQSTIVGTGENGVKIKQRVPRMRACDERTTKDKLCAGHLKRWYEAPEPVTRKWGDEMYRCERCHTLYLPHPQEQPRTRTLSW